MPRHDCFEIDYSLGGPALFSNGVSLGWHKDEKNLVLEQIVAKSNFLLQLPGDGFSLPFFFFSSSPQMAFQPSLEVKIRRRVRCPSQILVIVVRLSLPSLLDRMSTKVVPWDFTIRHIALVLTEFRLRLFLFLFVFSFLPLFNTALNETSV